MLDRALEVVGVVPILVWHRQNSEEDSADGVLATSGSLGQVLAAVGLAASGEAVGSTPRRTSSCLPWHPGTPRV